MKKLIIVAAATAALTACASQPDDIHTAYVSTLQYKKYDCDQLSMEAERVSGRTVELYHSLKTTADDDEVQMAVGVLLLWPTLFFLEGGDDARAQEYARLKGERGAIEKVSVQKECDIQFQAVTPKKTTTGS